MDAATKQTLDDLLRKRADIERQITAIENAEQARKWRLLIEAHDITLDAVELSDGEEKPYFSIATEFNKWCREHSRKRFACWNGLVYLRGDCCGTVLCHIDMLKGKS